MASRMMLSRFLVKPAQFRMIYRSFCDAKPEMPFIFACPASVFYSNADVKQVDVPGFSSSMGILPKHVPIISALKPGVVTVTESDGNLKKYFVSSGSLSVNEDGSVQVLAEEAVKLEDLDATAARQGLENANREASSASDEKAKAEAEISIEVYEALVRAAEQAN